MLHTKLAAMKARCGLSKQQIADKSGVPLSTVMRVFSGQTDNPTFHTVHDIVKAMGGSLNELDDVQPPPAPEKVPEKVLEMYETQVHQYETQIQQYEKQVRQKDKWLKFLFIACASLTAVIVGILLIDVLNGNIGYFRY